MSDNSQLQEKLDQVNDWLNEQEWYQELKDKWEGLDSETQVYVRYAALTGLGLVLTGFLLSYMTSVWSVKSQLEDKRELLNLTRSAMKQINAIKADSNSTSSNNDWPAFFRTSAAQAGIVTDAMKIGSPKTGNKDDLTSEKLYEIELSRINVRQAVKFSVALETRGKPVKLRHMNIETVGTDGYLNAKLAVSTFEMEQAR